MMLTVHDPRFMELCDRRGTVLHLARVPDDVAWPLVVRWVAEGAEERHFIQEVPGRRRTTSKGESIGRYVMVPVWTVA